MHELSIALSIVEMAEAEAVRSGSGQVHAVHLRLGRLSGVEKSALLASYEMACHATPLEGSRLLIEEIPIEVFCSRCGVARGVDSRQWFACTECGAPTPTILQGKEMEVVALEIQG